MRSKISVREGLGVVGVDALPAEAVPQVVGEGLLDQTVFAVDVGECHELFLARLLDFLWIIQTSRLPKKPLIYQDLVSGY